MPKASSLLTTKHPNLRKSRGAVQALLPIHRLRDRGRRAAAALLADFVYGAQFTPAGATQLRSCLIAVAKNGGWPSPRLLISQVPLSGICLSLRVPVAAWPWTEAQRVTKRGSPCPRGSQRLPGCVRAIFEAIADDLMNHRKHTWLRRGTVLPPAAVESGVSQNESAATEPQARGRRRGCALRISKVLGRGLRGPGVGAAGTQLSAFLRDSMGLPHPPEPAPWDLATLDTGSWTGPCTYRDSSTEKV